MKSLAEIGSAARERTNVLAIAMWSVLVADTMFPCGGIALDVWIKRGQSNLIAGIDESLVAADFETPSLLSMLVIGVSKASCFISSSMVWLKGGDDGERASRY